MRAPVHSTCSYRRVENSTISENLPSLTENAGAPTRSPHSIQPPLCDSLFLDASCHLLLLNAYVPSIFPMLNVFALSTLYTAPHCIIFFAFLKTFSKKTKKTSGNTAQQWRQQQQQLAESCY